MIRDCCNSFTDAAGRELLSHGTAAFPIACYNTDLSAETVPWHWHDEWEISLVLEGELQLYAGSHRRIFRPGEGYFINSRVLHSVERANDGVCRIRTIVFHPRLVGGDADSLFWQKFVQPLLAEPLQELFTLEMDAPWKRKACAILSAAWSACETGAPGFELELRSFLSRLIFCLAEHRSGELCAPGGREQRCDERIKIMLRFIHEHFAEEIDTAAIAASASVSPSECLRCFHAAIHATPIQYLRRYRIRRAAELLRLTDMRISEVAICCGFQEMSYFARTFRELQGVSPSMYRRGKAE